MNKRITALIDGGEIVYVVSISWCEILRIQDTNLLRFRLIFEYEDQLWSDDVQFIAGHGTPEEELNKIKHIVEKRIMSLYEDHNVNFKFNWNLPKRNTKQ